VIEPKTEKGHDYLTSKLFRLFMLILSSLDVYVWQPLFWLLVILFLSGLEEISSVRKGIIYTTKKERLISAISTIIIAVLLFWYYWLRPGGIHKLISM